MQVSTSLSLALLAAATTGCAAIRADAAASVSGSVAYASAYTFRGVPFSEGGSYQGDLSVGVPLTEGTLGVYAWGNMDASNDTGDALFPGGQAGELTELDLALDYSRDFDGFSGGVGLASYHVPSRAEASTSELFAALGTELFGLSHGATLYYDVDALHGFYLSLSSFRGWELGGKLSLDTGVALGWMDADQASFYFGTATSGLSDLSASATLNYAYDETTTLFLSLSGVSVLDENLRDALGASGFDDSRAWIAIGASFAL